MASLLDALETAAREGCAFVMLSQGRFALVDENDLEKADQYKWCCSQHGYAVTRQMGFCYLHRFVMDAGKGVTIDHKSRGTLDNRKQNLRACVQRQNTGNARKKTSAVASLFKGVGWDKPNRKWTARGKENYKSVWLGRFASEIEAARAYDRWALESFGEFAKINGV